uniref:Ribose-phosphate pyrophosphokinase n=1 Tax=candidate division WOR-3 bacterium TaxID=2052148 RepID=A0A7V3ZYJ6_UNCW3
MKLISGSNSRKLLEAIAGYLKIEPCAHEVTRFKDGEIRVQIKESVRGHDVFIIQSTEPPGDNLLELLLLIDAAKRASAKRITAVIPYFGYARQDRKDQPRVPISAKLVANLIQVAGTSRVLTLDLHADQIQGFFDIPVDNLYATPVFKEYFNNLDPTKDIVVAPDVGATKRARAFARRLGDVPIALIDKRRPEPNKAEVMNIVGDVKGKRCLIVDDIIDTGNTLVEAVKALLNNGAEEVKAVATHALFSDNCVEKLEKSELSEVVVTDSIPKVDQVKSNKIKVLSVAPLIGEAIRRIHDELSVSSLFI